MTTLSPDAKPSTFAMAELSRKIPSDPKELEAALAEIEKMRREEEAEEAAKAQPKVD